MKRAAGILMTMLLAFALSFSFAFAEEGETEAASDAQPVKEETEELPVGGWSPTEAIYVPEDFDLAVDTEDAGDTGKKKKIRNIINADQNSVFVKGTSAVGYNALTQAQKQVYNTIDEAATAFMNAEEDLQPTSGKYYFGKVAFGDKGITQDQALQVFYAYDYDHPGYYWISNRIWYSSSYLYLCTEEEYAKVSTRQAINLLVSSGVKEYARAAESGTNTLDKIAIVHDWIVNSIDYAYKSDGSTPESEKWAHSVHGVFDPNHRATVCEGYADSFALVMNYMDIPNYYIVGTAGSGGAGSGGGHAWNAVSADNGATYMYMDLTWDDFGGDQGYAYKYFGMPKTDFETTHFKYGPTGTGSKWLYDISEILSDSAAETYYMKGGLYYDGGGQSAEAFAAAVVSKAARAGGWVSFMCPDKNSLVAVADELDSKYSYYTTSYKGTAYYYKVTAIGGTHTHSWSEPAYTWTPDKSTVTAVRICQAANCDVGAEMETVSTTPQTTDATCIQNGRILYEATFENTAFATQTEEKTIPALGHDYKEVPGSAVAVTCTTDGKEADQKCSRCNDVITGETIKAPGHNYEEVEGSAITVTCTTDGKEVDQKCSRCNDVITGETIKAPGHNYEEVAGSAVAVTCTTDGKEVDQKCSRCDSVISGETITALGHEWGEPVYQWAGDKSTLTATRYCAHDVNREHVETETVGVTEAITEDSTCSKEGVRTYTSGAFKNPAFEVQTTIEAIAMEDHTPAEPVEENRIEPTCTLPGSYDLVTRCAVCTAELKRESVSIEALDHDLISHEAKAPTCTRSGWEEYETCSRCDYSSMKKIAAMGHIWQHVKVKAGLLKNGSEYDRCKTCGAKKNVKTLVGYATYYVKGFKVASGKKSFTAKWAKQTKAKQKKFSGYQIRYSLKSGMGGAKYAYAGKASKSKTIKRLKAKKYYYIQVRTYTKSGGKTFYSKWSAKKKVKTK